MQSKILLVAGAPSDAEVVDPLAVAVHEGGEGEGDAPLHGLHTLRDIGHLGGGVAHGHQGWAIQVCLDYRIIKYNYLLSRPRWSPPRPERQWPR